MKRYSALIANSGLWLSGLGVLGNLAGCANMVESRVISAFSEGLQKKDIAGVRNASSSDFENKVLNAGTPWPTLEHLEFPDGKTEVVKVENFKDDNKNDIKKVTVAVGKHKRKVIYRLKQETDTKKWVVDDVFLDPKNLEEDKSVATQLQLHLSVADLLETWRRADRSRILATTTNDFRQVLSDLPPERVGILANQTFSDVPKSITPSAVEIIDDKATVKLPADKRQIVLQLRRQKGQWLMDEMSVESREGDAISSMRNLAAATTAGIAFYSAYQSSDKRNLARVSTPEFFKSTLEVADLSQIKLPLPSTGAHDFETRLEGAAAEVVVSTPTQTVKISLARKTREAENVIPSYLVREVTLYDIKSAQDMRLSAVFNGQAVMQVFSDALRQRDLKTIKGLATADFNRRVWEKTSADTLLALPLDEIEDAEPRIENSIYRGPVTKITVTQGETPLTFVLRDVGGRTLVDDLETPSPDRQTSFKSRLELLIPVIDFAEGFRRSSLDLVRANASRRFSQVVWNQIRTMPRLAVSPEQFMQGPVTKIVPNSDSAHIYFGDEKHGAKVFLHREGDQYLVDDIMLISGTEPQQRMQLLQIMRTRIARGDDVQDLQHSRPETAGVRSRVETVAFDDDQAAPALPRRSANRPALQAAPAEQDETPDETR
jgi:hypothetical protein